MIIRVVRYVGILDPIMLITGAQSVFESQGEFVVANCEILKDFQRFSEHFRIFHGIWDFRVPESIVCSRGRAQNLMTPSERARQTVLHSDTRFHQVAGFPALR